jgi:hypothetical protein
MVKAKLERHTLSEFCKSFDVKFANAEGKEYVWGTSWGFDSFDGSIG